MESESNFSNVFKNEQIGFNSEAFKKTLYRFGVRNESEMVKMYAFPIEFNVPTVYFLGVQSDYTEPIDFTGLIDHIISNKFTDFRDYFDDKKYVKIDKVIYIRLTQLLKKNNLQEHIEPIASILKEGYYNRFLSITRSKVNETKLFEKNIQDFKRIISSNHLIKSIRIKADKSEVVNIQSRILIVLINEYFNKMFVHNDNSPDFINQYLNNLKGNKRLPIIKLEDYHLEITVYKIIFYLYKHTDYLKKKNANKVSLTEKEYELVGDLLTESKNVDEKILNVPRFGLNVRK